MPSADFMTISDANKFTLSRARVPVTLLGMTPQGTVDNDGLIDIDLEISDGLVTAVEPAGTIPSQNVIDLAGRQVWPGFIDLHTHLDITQTWPRNPNLDGTLPGAIAAATIDRDTCWPPDDLYRRFEFGLRCAYAHGTVALRTHLDSRPAVVDERWKVFRKLREQWAGRIELQATSIAPMQVFESEYGITLADLIARYGGHLGAIARVEAAADGSSSLKFQDLLDRIFDLAEARSLDLDFHVDESGDANATALNRIARTAIRRGFHGKILCGHCCSLAIQSEDAVESTLRACVDAGIAIVSLPMCNMYLQGRSEKRTPRWRGVTLIQELAAHNIPIAVASDDCRNSFHSFGDHDMFEVFAQSVRIAHLDHPFAAWPRSATLTPALIMNLKTGGIIRPFDPANLVLFNARTMSELLARPQSDRIVLRRGRQIDRTLPNFQELDDLQHPRC